MRCLLLFVAAAGLAVLPAFGQTQEAAPSRETRLEERYRAMLDANPSEGMALDRLWKAHEENGTTAALVEFYKKAAEAADAPAAPMLVYGHLLKRTGKLEEAASWYERAAEREGNNPLPILAQADLLSQRGLGERAAGSYGRALEMLPANDRRRADLLLKQGGAFLAAGKTAEAAECWEKIVAASPNDLAVRKQLADAYEKNGLLDRAIGHHEFIAAHASPPERAGAWRELGRLREARGDFEGARTALESGLNLTARDNWLHGDLQTRLIRLYQRAGKTDELAGKWRDAVEAAPRDLGGYLRLEALAEAQGDAAGQREWLDKIVALSPRDRENVLKLAGRLVNAGELPRAADLYDGLLKLQPANLDLLLARSDLDVQMGQTASATKRLEDLAARNPADESIHTAALGFFLRHHLSEAAERTLRAEVARQPAAPEPVLALAKFLFAERRGNEAAAVLADLTARPGDPAARANRLSLAAEAYKGGNLPDDALRCWEEMAALRPDDPAPLVAAAELRRTRGELPAAVDLLERAVALSPVGDARQGMEKRLFDVLRGESSGEGAEPSDLFDPTARRRTPRPARNSLLGRYLADLTAQARTEKTAEGHLRLARWEAWAHEDDKALAACRAALVLDPDNLPTRQLAADIAAEGRQIPLAEQMLTEILDRNPASEGTTLRQLAKLKLQSGDNEGALELFTRLQSMAPGSRAALTDLALAQQRLDRWFDAKTTWEQAYALPGATPAQRGEVRRALLGACEHLGQFERAVELLSEAVDEQPDQAGKEETFRQLAEMASKHGMDEAVRQGLMARLERRPDDYLALVSLAQLARDGGDPEESYRLLRRAHYSSPDPARSLRALVQEAESLGKADEAEADQARLTAMPGQFTAENLEKLAGLQEANLHPEEAAATWNKTVARFPRDPGMAAKAADYFERADQPDRARQLQRQAVELEPKDFGRVLRLAALDVRAGDLSAAVASYDQVLLHTQKEAPGEPLSPPDDLTVRPDPFSGVFPRAGRVGGSRFVPISPAVPKAAPAPPPKSLNPDRSLRLQAITEAAQALFDPRNPADAATDKLRADWLARWQKAADAGARNEPLAALYSARQKDATMALFTRWLAKEGEPDLVISNAFLCAGLQLGDYEALARWTWASAEADTPTDRAPSLTSALLQFLGTGGKATPGMMAALFPPEVKRQELLWEAARSLASLHWYGPAGELGQRAVALQEGTRAAFALQTAEWQLTGGDAGGARDTLKLALGEGGGWTFDMNTSPIFGVLREYYLLLPEAERASFAASYLAAPRAKGEKTHALLAAALLHGLSGDDDAARRDLDILLNRRLVSNEEDEPSLIERRWSYLLTNGVQLQMWNLDGLAAYLWEGALKEETVFDDKVGAEGGSALEIRRRLLDIKVGRADDPEQAREIVVDYLRTNPPPGIAISVAGELMNDSRFSTALQISEYLCRLDANSMDYLSRLFSAYEASGNPDRLEATLERIATGEPLLEGGTMAGLTSRWAAVRERNGDPEGARLILERTYADRPGELTSLVQLAQFCERANRLDQAADLWRERLPMDTSNLAAVNLARIEEKRGRLAEAAKLLEGALSRTKAGGSPDAAGQLARIYLAAGEVDKAENLARRVLHDGLTEAVTHVASALGNAGRKKAAVDLLNAASVRTRDPAERFGWQVQLVPLLPSFQEDPRTFQRVMARLEILARDAPTARNTWETTRYRLAKQAGADAWLETDLRRRWDSGKGDYAAGERLAALYLAIHRDEDLARTIDEFNHRPKLPDQLLYGLEKVLLDGGKAALALPISERLYRRFPQNINYAVGRATTLWKAGQRDAAKEVFDTLANRAILRDDLNEQVGLAYVGLGEKALAREAFGRTVRVDPLATRSLGSFLQLARLETEAGHMEEAGKLLVTAYRQDGCNDFAPLVSFLAASGQLDGEKALRMPAEEFLLSFHRRARLLVAVHDHLNRVGRNAEARKLLRRHAAFLAEVPEEAAALREESPAEEQPLVAKCLRRAAEVIAPPLPRMARLIAVLPPEEDAATPAASR